MPQHERCPVGQGLENEDSYRLNYCMALATSKLCDMQADVCLSCGLSRKSSSCAGLCFFIGLKMPGRVTHKSAM